jgi:hypothetical protein
MIEIGHTIVWGVWTDEVEAWLDANCKGRWNWLTRENFPVRRTKFILYDKEDAVAFKIKFGFLNV